MAAFSLLFLVALTLGTGCSLTLDLEECDDDDDCSADQTCTSDNICEGQPVVDDQCEEDTDCDEGHICGQNGECVDASAQCEIDEDCEPVFGEGATCDDGLCVGETELVAGSCQRLYGPVTEEDTFLVGVVLQLSGVGAGFGQPMLDAMRIAKRDINSIGGIDGRQIGLIACDTEASDAIAKEAAEHLVDHVDVILGLNSSQVISIGPDVTVPSETLLMSPSATAQTISLLNDDDLIWRTAPSDAHQAIALAGLIEHASQDFLTDETEDNPFRITYLVRRQDLWADGLFDELIQELPADLTDTTETGRATHHTYANVGAGEPADYTDVAAEIAADDHPDMVVILGSAESWEVIDHIENVVDTEPLYIGADAMKNVQESADASPELEHRIWGTGPRSAAELDYQPYTIFRLKFEREMNDDADNYQFVANAFDALYTVAFGAAAGMSTESENDEFTAFDLAAGLQKLGSGDNFRPSSSDAQEAILSLLEGNSINYEGASGPIDFDENGDPQPMPIALWCFEDGEVPEREDIYDPVSGVFTPATCAPEEE